MSRTASIRNLDRAKAAKKDEFYTQLSDIESELRHYKQHFRGKTVLCNCDDPRVSQFFRYFALQFESLGLKKLITTCYKSQEIDLFSRHDSERAIWLEYLGGLDRSRMPDADEIGVDLLQGDGDFRSDECIALMREADIVVTNPPFSLFREYVAQLIESNKKFVIVGSYNAASYKEIFALIKEGKIWLGYGFEGGNAYFATPYTKEFAKGVYDAQTGLVKFRNAAWFTNLDHVKRHEDLMLHQKYNPDDYPRYENYDAINVDKTKDIPADYAGAMGVPITFLDKYNPDQFEIIALGIVGSIEFTANQKMHILDKAGSPTGKFTWNAKGTLYRLYNPKKDKAPAFKDVETGALYSSIYARVIIRNKQVQK